MAFEAGNGIIIDSRSEFDYELGHIRGSVNLPLKEFEARKSMLNSWPKDTLLITYCDGQECNSSMELAEKLAESGFTNVKFFFGGWTEWHQRQSPEEGSPE
jgi:rhodanese-related sulfurtransferase